jgi:hypothetical protein
MIADLSAAYIGEQKSFLSSAIVKGLEGDNESERGKKFSFQLSQLSPSLLITFYRLAAFFSLSQFHNLSPAQPSSS